MTRKNSNNQQKKDKTGKKKMKSGSSIGKPLKHTDGSQVFGYNKKLSKVDEAILKEESKRGHIQKNHYVSTIYCNARLVSSQKRDTLGELQTDISDNEVMYSCDSEAVYYYELNGTIALRCNQHKHDDIESTIISQGDLLEEEVERELQYQELKDRCDDRLKQQGVKDIDGHHEVVSKITAEIYGCTPSRFKKLKKEVMRRFGQKEYDDVVRLYKLHNTYLNPKTKKTEQKDLKIRAQEMVANLKKQYKDKDIPLTKTNYIKQCLIDGTDLVVVGFGHVLLFNEQADMYFLNLLTEYNKLIDTCRVCEGMSTRRAREHLIEAHLKKDHKEIFSKIEVQADRMNANNLIATERLGWLDVERNEEEVEEEIVVETKKKKISYEEFCTFAKELKIHSRTDWINFSKTDNCPDNVPVNPHTYYKDDWEGYPIVFGYEQKVRRKAMTREHILETIRRFRDRWLDYQLYPDAYLTNWFETQGLFSVKDPYLKQMFKNFIAWRNDPEGKKALEHWLLYEDFDIPYGGYTLEFSQQEEEKEEYMDKQSTKLTEVREIGLLEQPKPIGVNKIMLDALEVVPIKDEDVKWYWTQVKFRVKQIWEQLFDEDRFDEQLEELKNQGTKTNEFHSDILEMFWYEYKYVENLWIGGDAYTSDKKPKLIQLYGAYKMTKVNGFFNMSSTGAYKTGMAIMSVLATKSSFCLVLVPKNIIDQWKKVIKDFYHNLYVSVGKQINPLFWEYRNQLKAKNRPNFHVINYDRFSRAKSAEKIIKDIEKHGGKIDFIISDEAHFLKNSGDEYTITARRKNIERLVQAVRKQNRKVKFLMLSATPIVNNIREGKSLLELLTGTKYDFSTYHSIRNATKLYTEFIPYSMNYVKTYNDIEVIGDDSPIIVDGYIPEYYTEENMKQLLNWNTLERIATEYRIPEILRLIREHGSPAIIYTDYTVGVVEQLHKACAEAGYKVGLFTGEDKTGHFRETGRKDEYGEEIIESPFLLGEIDVLIASRPFAVGLDGMQMVCNNLIFNGLVWTYAQFEQIRGRIIRPKGTEEKSKAYVNMVFAKLNGFDYDEKVKYNRLKAKRALGDCIRHGTLPEKLNFGDTETLRLEVIEKMLTNRDTGFPEKEQVEKQLELEAIQELEAKESELEKLQGEK